MSEEEKRRQAKLEIFITDSGKLGYIYEDDSGGPGGLEQSDEEYGRDIGKLLAEMLPVAATKQVLNSLKNWAGMQRRRKPGHVVKSKRVVLKEWFYTLEAGVRYSKALPMKLKAAVAADMECAGLDDIAKTVRGAAEAVCELLADPLIHICVAKDEDGRLYRGVAICNLYDIPIESTGRNIARGRAYQAWHNKSNSEVIVSEPELQVMRLCGAPEWLYKSQADPVLSSTEQELIDTVEK